MPPADRNSRARLAEMGIEVWLRRAPRRPNAAADNADGVEARVRLAAGDGAWLLVQRRPWDGQHAQLMADLQALLGIDQCRFGQWAASRDAGHAVSELPERGVRHVLAFGPVPSGAQSEGLVEVPPLDELAASASARRALWQALRPLLRN